MERLRSTESNKSEQSQLHCPFCDKKFFTAALVVDLIVKCDKCHRRYKVNITSGHLSIELISKPNDRNSD